jgi:hypothetical protein
VVLGVVADALHDGGEDTSVPGGDLRVPVHLCLPQGDHFLGACGNPFTYLLALCGKLADLVPQLLRVAGGDLVGQGVNRPLQFVRPVLAGGAEQEDA